MLYQKKAHLLSILSALCLCLFLLTGCKDKDADIVPDSQTQSDLDSENAHNLFTAFTDRLFLNEVTSDSISLHYTVASPEALSIPAQEPSLGHISEQSRIDGIQQVRSYLNELKDISYDALPKEDQITYDILKWQFEAVSSSQDFSYFSESISPSIGIQAQLPILLAEYEFRCSKDIEDYILLLRKLPDYYTELAAYEKEKASAGLFMPEYTVDAVVNQCKDFLCDVNSHYLTTTFQQKISALTWLSEEQKTQFQQLNKDTLTQYVYPAYETLVNELNALKDTNTNQEGLCHFPNGKEYYAYLVKMSTGSDSSPDELITRTSSQMQEDLLSMSAIMEKTPAALDNLNALSISYTEPEQILTHLKDCIQKDFPSPPNVDCTIKYVDASLEKHLSPAFYLTPPIDRISQNVIYINKPSFHDDIQLFTTMAHEGYPGHLYQNIFTQNSSLNKSRALFSFPGYAEGYATYAELYSYQYMGLDETVSELLRLSSSVTLGIYASLDLGIHHLGWSMEQAKELLVKYGITDESAVTSIYQAIVAEPANYLKYYIGYLEFLTLRKEAKEVWKTDYSDKKFHQYIVEMGDAPFAVLKKYL